MRAIFPLLAFLTFVVLPASANDPYAELEALTQVKNRYVIGPWQGALVGGQNCQLVNTETLQGVEFSLSAARSNPSTTIQLGADFLHDPKLNNLQVLLDNGTPEVRQFSVHKFGLFYMPTSEQLEALKKAKFVTFIMGRTEKDQTGKDIYKLSGRVSFDLRGYAAAYELFDACIAGREPASYPQQPLEEGEPRTVKDAPGWEVIDLSFEGKPYQRLASLKANGDFALSLWVHNRAQYVLNVTSFKELTNIKNLKAVQITLDGKEKLAVPAVVQPDGILVPLGFEHVRKIAKAQQIEIAGGLLKATFAIPGFAKVAQAIQLTD
jgi:hypothetical protein